MKKKNRLIIILLVAILMTSGCTKYLTDGNKKRIINETTGQAVTSNILCLPENKDLLDIYESNKENLKVNYDDLKSCSKYSPSDIEYKSLWESLFIKPLAWIIIKVGLAVKNYGLAVIILGIVIRLILLPFTFKSSAQSENLKKAQPELQAIQKKYGNSANQDRAQALQMSQEMSMVYKKYGISPGSGCITAFIQLPILFAFLEAINRVPAIFEENFLTLQLGTSPSVGIRSGNLLYIVLIVLIIGTTYYSYKNVMSTSSGNSEQDSQSAIMMKFMVVFIAIASFSLPTALALYWIISNIFMIVQNIVYKKIKENKKSTGKVKKTKRKESSKNGSK